MKKPAGFIVPAGLTLNLVCGLGRRPPTRHRVAEMMVVMCRCKQHNEEQPYNNDLSPVNPKLFCSPFSSDLFGPDTSGRVPAANLFLDMGIVAVIMAAWSAEAVVLFTVEELEHHPIAVSTAYAPGALGYHGAEFRQSSPLNVNAVAELVGAEIRVRGHLGTHLAASCDRCLAAVDIPVEQDFDLIYRPLTSIAREEEIEVSDDEADVAFYSGEGVDLADVVQEQVILAVPMKIVCRAECLGLCPVCGANRNVEHCHCSTRRDDSPFASLKED